MPTSSRKAFGSPYLRPSLLHLLNLRIELGRALLVDVRSCWAPGGGLVVWYENFRGCWRRIEVEWKEDESLSRGGDDVGLLTGRLAEVCEPRPNRPLYNSVTCLLSTDVSWLLPTSLWFSNTHRYIETNSGNGDFDGVAYSTGIGSSKSMFLKVPAVFVLKYTQGIPSVNLLYSSCFGHARSCKPARATTTFDYGYEAVSRDSFVLPLDIFIDITKPYSLRLRADDSNPSHAIAHLPNTIELHLLTPSRHHFALSKGSHTGYDDTLPTTNLRSKHIQVSNRLRSKHDIYVEMELELVRLELSWGVFLHLQFERSLSSQDDYRCIVLELAPFDRREKPLPSYHFCGTIQTGSDVSTHSL
ncbi:hypothetical protein BDQ17DRAFT_1436650 [Cyathus striatus]|nr:hypothetical protein BDQ17DRAFT_1436650 [Cyathus striatus]